MSAYSNTGVGESLISAKWKKTKSILGKWLFSSFQLDSTINGSLKINKTAFETSVSKYTNVPNWYGFHWENA